MSTVQETFYFTKGPNGEWAVGGSAGAENKIVTVKKKNGDAKRFQLGRVLGVAWGKTTVYEIKSEVKDNGVAAIQDEEGDFPSNSQLSYLTHLCMSISKLDKDGESVMFDKANEIYDEMDRNVTKESVNTAIDKAKAVLEATN